jgi:hypothetical protein
MRQRGPVIAGLAVGAATTLAIVIGGGLVGRPPDRPTASASPSGPAIGTGGPVVFYEIDDADGAKLMVRTLDGRSLAQVVATRADPDGARTWSVDPTGSFAIAATRRPDLSTRLEGVPVATGATSWSLDLPPTGVLDGVWSIDGRRFATTTDPDDPADRELIVVDSTSGLVARTALPDGALLQGFEPGGALILRQRRVTLDGDVAGWQFLRLDPAVGRIERLVVLPDVGPASGWNEDVDPATGIGFDQVVAPGDDTKTALRMWSVGTSTSRVLATFPMIDRMAMDPMGQAVAISVQKSILLVGLDGRKVEIWSGTDPATTFDWSSRGDYLAVTSDDAGPVLFVLERATGRGVQLPLPVAIAQAAFVRVLDGVALPTVALPAVEPTPTPTPGPSGPDLATSDGVYVGWAARAGGAAILHVERRVPTADGGMRTVAAMTPANLGAAELLDDGGLGIVLLPRPGSRDLLVSVQTPDATRSWIWAGDGTRRDTPLPPDWPATTYDLAWRPDGKAVAATTTIAVGGEPRTAVVVARLDGKKTTVLPIPVASQYDQFEGWWSPTELRLGHGICTEGCPGRYAWSARFGIATRRITELTPADRARGRVDNVIQVEPSGLDLLPGNEMPENTIHVDWPPALGATGPEFIGFAADGRSLLVAAIPADGTDVYRIDDPAGRAVKGRLADAAPVLIGHLARRGIDIRISPDEKWALTTDRTGGIELVELATGRAWPIDRETVTTWVGNGG